MARSRLAPVCELRLQLALIRFHVRAGVRLAWRIAIPVFTAPTLAVAMSPEPSGTLDRLARGAVAKTGGESLATLMALACLAVASWGAPRLAYGVRGWLRQLPAGDSAWRRSLTCALVLTELPVVALWALLCLFAWSQGIPVAARRAWSVLLMTVGAAQLALPKGIRRHAVFGGSLALAAALAADPRWMGIAVGGLFVFDSLSGASTNVRRARRRRWSTEARFLGLRVTSRAIGAPLLRRYVILVLPLTATALFLENNDLSLEQTELATRLGGGFSVAACVWWTSKLVLSRRPPWPWMRSLPWSSRHRVQEDVLFLALSAGPLLLLTGALRAHASAVVALALPWMAARGAAALRDRESMHAPERDLVLVELVLTACLLALVPKLAPALAILFPLALKWATEKERNTRVGRRNAMIDLGTGDTESWSGR
jgi:hypothetical protein